VHPDPDGAYGEQTMRGVSPPRARGWIHRVAFLVAGPAGIILLLVAPTWEARLAVTV